MDIWEVAGDEERSDGEEIVEEEKKIVTAFSFTNWDKETNIRRLTEETKNKQTTHKHITNPFNCYSTLHQFFPGEGQLRVYGDINTKNSPLCCHIIRRLNKKKKKEKPTPTSMITRSASKRRRTERTNGEKKEEPTPDPEGAPEN